MELKILKVQSGLEVSKIQMIFIQYNFVTPESQPLHLRQELELFESALKLT